MHLLLHKYGQLFVKALYLCGLVYNGAISRLFSPVIIAISMEKEIINTKVLRKIQRAIFINIKRRDRV